MSEKTPLDGIRPYSVTLSVKHLDSTTSWYQEKLEMRVAARREYPDFKTSLVFLEKNGFRVELISYGPSQQGAILPDPPTQMSLTGLTQFCFYVDNTDALEAQLNDRGVETVWKFENPDLGLKFFFIRDPEGNLIQFLQTIATN